MSAELEPIVPEGVTDALWHAYVDDDDADDDAADHSLDALSGPQLRRMAESVERLAGIIRQHQINRGGKAYRPWWAR